MTRAFLADFFDEHFPLRAGKECGCGWSSNGTAHGTWPYHVADLLGGERGRDLDLLRKAVRGG